MNRQPDDYRRKTQELCGAVSAIIMENATNRQPDDPGAHDPMYASPERRWILLAAFVAVFTFGLLVGAVFAKETPAGQERPPCEHPELRCCIVKSGHPLCVYEKD